MFFIIKKKEVVVDAFTHRGYVYDYFPIDSANNFMPEWWRNTPKYIKKEQNPENMPEIQGNTIRRCAGVIDYYNKNNLVIPLWSDLALDVGPNSFKYVFADMTTSLVRHEQAMRGTFMSSYEHFKICSPWKFKEKRGVKFHFSQMFYNFEDPGKIILPPAIVNYKYQHSTEINFMVKRPVSDQRITLTAGDPMVLLTPQTEYDVKVKTHLVSEEEYNRTSRWLFSFHNAYNKAKKIKQKNESKCPFGF